MLQWPRVDVFRVYVWTDDHGRKLKCSAPLYFDYAMSYIQELLTDEDVFPTKAGTRKMLPLALCPTELFFNSSVKLLPPALFSRFGVSDRLRLPRPESVLAVLQDSGSHILVPLQRDSGVGPAPTPQHTLHTPHTLLSATCSAGAGGHRAAAGPHHSSGPARLSSHAFTFHTRI